MNTSAYHIKNLCHQYGQQTVLKIKELDIPKGTITGLSGPNGSGKTTLLKILAFAMAPSKGQIFYNGQPCKTFSKQVRFRITLLTQRPYLLNRTVFENIAYSLKIKKETKNLKSRVYNALELVGLAPDDFADRRPAQLSGGEAQRVAMAARLVMEPQVLLLDEPVASVDIQSARLIRQATLNAKQLWGTTLIIVSHDLQWLHAACDRHLSIVNGTIYTTGKENVISGPFEPDGKNMLKKIFNDGQVLRMAAGSEKHHAALIPSSSIEIADTPFARHEGENHLKGQISSMFLERHTQSILTHINAGGQNIVLRLTPEETTQMHVHPGSFLYLKIQPKDICWI